MWHISKGLISLILDYRNGQKSPFCYITPPQIVINSMNTDCIYAWIWGEGVTKYNLAAVFKRIFSMVETHKKNSLTIN